MRNEVIFPRLIHIERVLNIVLNAQSGEPSFGFSLSFAQVPLWMNYECDHRSSFDYVEGRPTTSLMIDKTLTTEIRRVVTKNSLTRLPRSWNVVDPQSVGVQRPFNYHFPNFICLNIKEHAGVQG